MSTTVEQLLLGGFNRNSANDPGKLAADGELMAELNRVYQANWALAARSKPNQWSAPFSFTMLGTPPKFTLSGDLIDIIRIMDVSNKKVNVIPQNETWAGNETHLAPCVYQSGRTIYSRAQTGDPFSGQTLHGFWLDAPAPLTGLASILDERWPARHYQLLTALLAQYLSEKDAGRENSDRAATLQNVQRCALNFATEYQLEPSAVSWMHASVERAGVNAKLGGS